MIAIYYLIISQKVVIQRLLSTKNFVNKIFEPTKEWKS